MLNTKNKRHDIDAILKKTLRGSEKPSAELIRKTQYKINMEESGLNKKTVGRRLSSVAAVAAALVLITVTAFAAWGLLRPSDVARELGNPALGVAFESESAIKINESITSGGYVFTLMSIVSGEDITDTPIYSNGNILSDRTYVVLAIQREDGSSMPDILDDNHSAFFASPYIRGFKPWQVNLATIGSGGGHVETVVDGVRYRIIDVDNIKAFAGHGLYLGVNLGHLFDTNAFIFDASTGELRANPDFDGSSVVFELPIDVSFADPARAEEILSEIPFLQSDLFDNAYGLTNEELAEGVTFEVAQPLTLSEPLFEDRPNPGEGRFWMDYDSLRARADAPWLNFVTLQTLVPQLWLCLKQTLKESLSFLEMGTGFMGKKPQTGLW